MFLYILLEYQISKLDWFHKQSCDTEDWRIAAENSALLSQNKEYFKNGNVLFINCYNIS